MRQNRHGRLTIGALLPTGKHVRSVRLDGRKATYRVVSTARGRQVASTAGSVCGVTDLMVRYSADPREVHRRPAGGRNLRHPGRVDTLSSPDWHRRYDWNGERWAPTPYQQARTALMVLAILVGMVLLALVVLAATVGPAVVAIYDTFH